MGDINIKTCDFCQVYIRKMDKYSQIYFLTYGTRTKAGKKKDVCNKCIKKIIKFIK